MELIDIVRSLKPERLLALSSLHLSLDDEGYVQTHLMFLQFVSGREGMEWASSDAAPDKVHSGRVELPIVWRRVPEERALLDASSSLSEQIKALHAVKQLGPLRVVHWQQGDKQRRSKKSRPAWTVQTHAGTPFERANWVRTLARQHFESDEKVASIRESELQAGYSALSSPTSASAWFLALAEEHFLTAAQFDWQPESKARYFLALTLLFQRRLEEAIYQFSLDCDLRKDPVSLFLFYWGYFCQYPNLREAMETIDCSAYEREIFRLLSDPASRGPHITDRGPAAGLLYGLLQYLKRDYQASYDLLGHDTYATDFFPFWAVTFWMAMASLERGEEGNAQGLLDQSLSVAHPVFMQMPPVLLSPLRWFEQSHPAFFASFIRPLLASYHLI